MKLKSLFEKIHLWLGLITFPIVFFICITGTIIVFADEIIEVAAGKCRYVEEVKDEKIPVETILAKLKEEYPNRRIPSYMVTYRNPERSIRFNSYDPEKGLRMIYVDPYSGKILKDDGTIHFFYTTAHLHSSLLWHGVGEWIVDITIIIFIILLISGLILWWPASWTKKHRKGAFTVKWNASFKRINHDFHNVFGFYSLALALILGLTGLIIAFKPLAAVTTDLFGGNSKAPWEASYPGYNPDTTENYPINSIINKAFMQYPDRDELQILTYFLRDKGIIPVKATNQVNLKSVSNLDFLVYDRYTGEAIEISDEAIYTERLKNTIWMLHMGTWGLFGKIITFLGGLIISFLPISGFYIWWQKHKSSKRAKLRFAEI